MNEAIIPMVIVPLTFLFVLLIILIAKAPKAGAWVIGGLLLLAPVILYRFAAGGALAHEEAIPLFVVPVTFLFVLLVILLAKAPKVGVGLIVALIVMVVAGFFFVVPHMAGRAPSPQSYPMEQIWAPTQSSASISMSAGDVQGEVGGAHARLSVPSTSLSPAATSSSPLSPIWSEGVDQELEADVYPSSLAAAKALGRRMADPIRTVSGDPNAAVKVILFQENNERSLIATFGRSLERELPSVRCAIEADLRNIEPGEVGLTFRVVPGHFDVDAVQGGTIAFPNSQDSSQIVATATSTGRRASAEARFIDKSWVDSFGSYASARPNESFIIARSNGTCTSESEANQQALEDARARLTEALGRETGRSLADLGRPPISTTDVLNGGFIVDRFVQSLDTSTGKVWRQAMLVDVSGQKLWQLANVKVRQTREVQMSWARMGLSAVGVLVLIGVIYFFLNMATRGYYEWSLRIAGVVLAVVAIVSILMIVQ
ncbi:MAG: hypothetical protein ABFE01_25145 [Phycisphaerales bacterium]|jgi:hypothetical protein